MLISKSMFVRGTGCAKSSWLYLNKHEAGEANEYQVFLMSQGTYVGRKARLVFPEGKLVEYNKEFLNMEDDTRALLTASSVPQIFEATFITNDSIIMVDVLERIINPDGSQSFNIYEVKSGTNLKEYHVRDASYQAYVLRQKGLDIKNVYIMHIDGEYEKEGEEIEYEKLFVLNDITDDLISDESINNELSQLQNVLENEAEPETVIGSHCNNPYPCEYKQYCWKEQPKNSILNLYNSRKKFQFFHSGIETIDQLPVSALSKTSVVQSVQFTVANKKHNYTQKDEIRSFIKEIKYPINFLDFETFMTPMPMFENQRGYRQTLFQFSMHIKSRNGVLKHKEYLAPADGDRRREFAELLLEMDPGKGSIVVYNASFEAGRIRELAELYPDLAERLLELNHRMIDLIVPFRKGWYYKEEFKGSFSIKSTLPGLCGNDEDIDYKKLSIQNGGMAMMEYLKLFKEKDNAKVEEVRNNLLDYCCLDTYAMLKIYDKLKDISRPR
jgi:hypothetical protein